MCGFIAQLVEHRTGIAEVTGSNPVEALIFFRLLLSNCLNWKIYCDDHSSLSNILLLFSFHLCFLKSYPLDPFASKTNLKITPKTTGCYSQNGFQPIYCKGPYFQFRCPISFKRVSDLFYRAKWFVGRKVTRSDTCT